jgi:uncharacterized protein YcbK (DUF882 family)
MLNLGAYDVLTREVCSPAGVQGSPQVVAQPERRRLLLRAGIAIAQLAAPSIAIAADSRAFGFDRIRTLHMRRNETGESAHFMYWLDGRLVKDGYLYANYLLRDVRAGRSMFMSPALLDVIAWVQAFFRAYGRDEVVIVNSGYRTPATNGNIEGAAKNSLHMRGLAVDIAIPNVPTAYLGALLQRLSQGGVGVYQTKGFVHLDVGRVRTWRG